MDATRAENSRCYFVPCRETGNSGLVKKWAGNVVKRGQIWHGDYKMRVPQPTFNQRHSKETALPVSNLI